MFDAPGRLTSPATGQFGGAGQFRWEDLWFQTENDDQGNVRMATRQTWRPAVLFFSVPYE